MGNKTSGIVNIHGKDYKTVALRVTELRDSHPEWGIETGLIESNEIFVVMKAKILNEDGRVIGTGYAEEKRDSSQINRTSALENCETSAIGRALAACGYGGEEYASANEVENAIHQQDNADEKEWYNDFEVHKQTMIDQIGEGKEPDQIIKNLRDNFKVSKKVAEQIKGLKNENPN